MEYGRQLFFLQGLAHELSVDVVKDFGASRDEGLRVSHVVVSSFTWCSYSQGGGRVSLESTALGSVR